MNQFVTGDGNQKAMLLIEAREKRTLACWKHRVGKVGSAADWIPVRGALQVP